MGKNEPREFEVHGKTLTCPICRGTKFRTARAHLKEFGKWIFEMDLLPPTATIFTCEQCNHMLWFREK